MLLSGDQYLHLGYVLREWGRGDIKQQDVRVDVQSKFDHMVTSTKSSVGRGGEGREGEREGEKERRIKKKPTNSIQK